MRIHSNTLTERDAYDAAALAGVGFHRLSTHGSRSRAHALDVVLEGSGRTGGAWGNSGNAGAGSYVAATWDEWGIFLGELFRRDPDAHVPGIYHDGEHYRWVTGARFDALTPADQHKRHRWDAHGRSITGAYYVSECKCGAIQRRMAPGRPWDEVASA